MRRPSPSCKEPDIFFKPSRAAELLFRGPASISFLSALPHSRATPVSRAAWATAWATAGTTRGSKGLGMIFSSDSSSSPDQAGQGPGGGHLHLLS